MRNILQFQQHPQSDDLIDHENSTKPTKITLSELQQTTFEKYYQKYEPTTIVEMPKHHKFLLLSDMIEMEIVIMSSKVKMQKAELKIQNKKSHIDTTKCFLQRDDNTPLVLRVKHFWEVKNRERLGQQNVCFIIS